MTDPHVLIVGSGSVGKRHARNLAALGCRVSCMDPRADRRAELGAETPVAGAFDALEAALDGAEALSGVVIASPPSFHVAQTIAAVDRGLPVLLEKPVCPEGKDAHRLLEHVAGRDTPVLMGYTWRWWPPLAKVRELLRTRAVGRLRHARFVMSAHLADWHPWEPIGDFFMSRRELGGGALLDESHWIDLMLWLFGDPEGVFARIEKLSDLEITSDDNVDMVVTYPDGLRVSLHLDLYGRPHEKEITLVGEKGTLRWSADPNRLAVGREMGPVWETTDFDCERNDMFVAVAREFLDVLAGRPVATCTLAEGVRVLDVVEAARESHATGRAVPFAGGRG